MIPLFAPRAHDGGARNSSNCTILTKNFAKLCAICLLQFIPKYDILYMSRGEGCAETKVDNGRTETTP
jgi:hypothetical protein